jgi:hypothetical protein
MLEETIGGATEGKNDRVSNSEIHHICERTIHKETN